MRTVGSELDAYLLVSLSTRLLPDVVSQHGLRHMPCDGRGGVIAL